MARAREAVQGESNGRDRGRSRFGFRLSRVRIRMRRDEIADASTGGGFIAPMDGDEERAGLLVMADDDLHDARAVRGRDAREPTVGKPSLVRVYRVDLDKRLRHMHREARAQAGARHRMPLIADAAGIETEGIGRRRLLAQRRHLRAHEQGFSVRRKEPAGGEEAPLL